MEATTAVNVNLNNITALVQQSQDTRLNSWEVNFEKNHKEFAIALAEAIAKKALNSFSDDLKDPFKKKPLSKDKCVKTVLNLDISYRDYSGAAEASKETLKLLEGKEIQEPFKEWITRFSEKGANHGIDKDYFQNLMSLVALVAREKIVAIVEEYKKQDGNQCVESHVSLVAPYGEATSTISRDGKDLVIEIKLWLKENSINNSLVTDKTESTLAAHLEKVEKKKKADIRSEMISRLAPLVVIAIVYFAIDYFKNTYHNTHKIEL